MDLASLHFMRPWWLLALPLALVLPAAWRYYRRPSGDWQKVCDPHLLRWLSVGKQSAPPGIKGTLLAGVVLVVAALALAGPSWTRLPDASYAARDAKVLVVDLSASMLAQDLRPDRLTQARYRLRDMLETTREGQVGLVAYAGDAYVVSPLTSDTNTIANMLPALQPDIMPVAGSRADRAMELAADLLAKAGLAHGEILLVSDGADASDALAAARLAERGIVTSVLAVGTRKGAPIPSGSGFVSDAQGSVVIARLGLESLVAVATAGGGRLTRLEAGAGAESPWLSAGGGEFSLRDDALGERWKDAGPWFVLFLLPLLAAGFRRGLLFAMAVLALPGVLVSPAANAGFWDDLWQRRDQQAQTALRENRAAEAARLAERPEISAEAWYRAGDYAAAFQNWAQGSGADAHYNQGNALALAGDLEAALAAYDRALSLNPEMEDALFNRALVEKLKEQQDREQEGEQGDSSEEQGEGEQDQQPQQGEGEPQEGEEPTDPSEQETGDQGDPSQQEIEMAWSEEDQQAMEQWLRRIPDDPGGLLRRKFRNQHLRRGSPEDERKAW